MLCAGALLFLLYINDMVNCINDEDVKLVLYADDTNIFMGGGGGGGASLLLEMTKQPNSRKPDLNSSK